MLLYWIILLYILISPISSQCERPALTCSALTQTVTIWGGSATGLILGQYTNDQLLFVGCSHNICTFSCVQAVDSMTFRSLNAYPYRMLAVLGPSPIPSFGAFACSTSTTPYNVIDAPDVASSINKLCQQIGYKVGTFTSWSGNRCPSVLWDGTSWTSDWISTDGVVTQSITCSQKCTAAPTKNPTNIPTNTPTNHPTNTPTNNPTNIPTFSPLNPTFSPTKNPTLSPTTFPTTKLATHIPTSSIPTNKPTNIPTEHPVIVQPTNIPTNKPTNRPTKLPINIATITIQLHDEAVQESTAITSNNDIDSNIDNGVSKNDTNSSMTWIIVIALIFALIASVICLLLIIGVWYARKRKAKNLQRYMQDKQRQRQCVRVVSSSDVVATPSEGFDSQSPAVLTVNTLGKIYGNVHGMVDGVELGSMLSVTSTSVGSDLDFDVDNGINGMMNVSTPGNDDFKQTCTAVHVNVGSISPIAMGEDDCGLNDNTGNVDCLRLSSVTPGNIDTGVPLRENEFVVNASEEAMDEFDEIDAIDNIENVETKGSGEFDDNEGDDMMMISSYVNNVTPY